MEQQSLTVVLPMFNQERQLRTAVLDILELGLTTSSLLQIVIVDDGSTDETYESACELARIYPQIKVLRQSVQRGLSAALDLVRHRIVAEVVIAHDGVSDLDTAELKTLLQESQHAVPAEVRSSEGLDSHGSRRFAPVRSLHNNMERAHRSVSGFCWIRLENRLVPRRRGTIGEASRCEISCARGLFEREPSRTTD